MQAAATRVAQSPTKAAVATGAMTILLTIQKAIFVMASTKLNFIAYVVLLRRQGSHDVSSINDIQPASVVE